MMTVDVRDFVPIDLAAVWQRCIEGRLDIFTAANDLTILRHDAAYDDDVCRALGLEVQVLPDVRHFDFGTSTRLAPLVSGILDRHATGTLQLAE